MPSRNESEAGMAPFCSKKSTLHIDWAYELINMECFLMRTGINNKAERKKRSCLDSGGFPLKVMEKPPKPW